MDTNYEIAHVSEVRYVCLFFDFLHKYTWNTMNMTFAKIKTISKRNNFKKPIFQTTTCLGLLNSVACSWQVNIYKLHVVIIMLHVNIIYLACRGRNMPP